MRLSVRLASLGARQKNTLYADVRRRLYPKNSKRDTIKVFKSIVKRYEDFQNYLALNQLDSWLEMDIVMGITGGKVLLTFNLSLCNFIFARLLDNKTALEVTKHLYKLQNTLHQADKDFCQLFPVILTDSGGEFARVDDIEMDLRGESKLFFCAPNRSDQKERIEKNHTLIRDIIPKGTSVDNLTQENINLVRYHVNSVKRASLINITWNL